MSSNNDTIQKTFLVAFLLCFVCSILVSGAAVLLKPEQIANKKLDKQKNILAAAGLLDPAKSVDESFKLIETRIVNLETGRFATEQELAEFNIVADKYDQKKAAKDPKLSSVLAKSKDKASIRRLEKFAVIYLVKNEGELDRIVLPVHGYGLWSTLYGFIALEGDLNTVIGLGFYEHAETPGLGGEVDNPSWKALWKGKKAFKDGVARLEVIKGKVDPASSDVAYKVDGLSGATLTSRGVSNLVQFWLGIDAFGPFLNTLKTEGV